MKKELTEKEDYKNMETGGIYEVLNPRGVELLKEGTPLNDRLSDLTDKKVYLIDVGKQQSNST